MNPVIRNILAIVAGVLIGWAVNMGLIMVSSFVIPPPEGIDPTNMESLKENMHLMQMKHYIFPFLAHALGTLAGALLAAKLAATHKKTIGLALGTFFLLGGIMSGFMLPAPTWFIIVDLVGAYIPMAFLGIALAKAKKE
jgi:hypothetical protein